MGTSGSGRGAASNGRPYRETLSKPRKGRCAGRSGRGTPERTSSGTPLGPNLSAAIFPELTSESSAAQSERGHRVRAEVLHIGWQLTHQCRGAGETQRSIFSPRRNRRSAGSHKVAVNKVWICPATRAPKPASHTRAEKLGGQDQHRQRRDPCRKAEHQQRREDDLDRLP